MDKTRAQVDAVQHGIHVVQTFLKECAEPQVVPYLLASTVLNALQEYYRSQCEMACKIFEARLCSLSPEESGISCVILCYLLRDGTTVKEMTRIRISVMKAIVEFPDLVWRLEVESADGEHFKILWQMTEHQQTAIKLWEKNKASVLGLRK